MKVSLIFRKKRVEYNSIEELFISIKNELGKTNSTSLDEVKKSGGSPITIFQNLLSFQKEKSTLYHITGDVHYMALTTGKRTVLTIHDVGSAVTGNMIRKLYIKLFWFWLPALFVKRITVISEFTKKELSLIIPFAKKKIVVVYNPVSPLFKYIPKEFNSIKPIILLMGTKKNKNLERVFSALQGIECQLLIVGKLTVEHNKLLEKLHIDYINKVNLKFEEIIQCYKSCDLLCYPSTYEGFGMPVIEAQAIGRPVLTSNLCSLPEVAGDGAFIVDPYNVESIRSGVLKIISDSDVRTDLINKGLKNIQRFKIEQITKEYLNLYTTI